MLIPLDDPIWGRLYGPYPDRRPHERLAALIQHWDPKSANELFWTEISHQSNLYPVTYASLPWIWNEFPRDEQTLRFLSEVIWLAVDPDNIRGSAKYAGLFLDAKHHQASWLPEEQWLTDDDMTIIAGLQSWLDDNIDDIVAAILVAAKNADIWTLAFLAGAYFAVNGKFTVGEAAVMVAGEVEPDEILDELGLDSPEAVAQFRRDIELVAPLSTELYEGLQALAELMER